MSFRAPPMSFRAQREISSETAAFEISHFVRDDIVNVRNDRSSDSPPVFKKLRGGGGSRTNAGLGLKTQ